MNNTAVILKVSQKTGIAPDVCDRIVKALEETLQEELCNKPGAGVLNRIAGAVHRMTSGKGS